MWRALIIAWVLAGSGTTLAADAGPLRAELRRLQSELAGIRSIQLARLQDPNLRTAALEVRLSRLEELMRQLTGRIEEVEYAQRQTSARIDQLVADLDARLSGQEPVGGAPATQARPAQEALATPAPALPPRITQPSIVAPDQSARQ